MLPQRFRLRHRNDFQRLRSHGRKQVGKHAVLVYLPNQLQNSRFAFVASRRVGNAVRRNRSKRLLREVVRRHSRSVWDNNVSGVQPPDNVIVHVPAGWDCLLIARSSTPDASFDEVEQSVLSLLKRAGVGS